MAESRRQRADRAHALIREGKYGEAIALFDELVEFVDLPLQAYCNALWVAQQDNTKLPIDAARSRKYLATCVPYGGANAPIYLNASGVCVEINELDQAIDCLVLAKRGGVDLAPYLDEPLFAPLRAHVRWNEVLEAASEVRVPSRLAIAEAAIARGEHAHAVPALRLVWRATRSPRVADLLDRVDVVCGRRVGYAAAWIEEGLAAGSLALIDELIDELGHSGCVLRDGKGGYGQKEGIWLVDDCDDPRFATGLLHVMAASPPLPERMKIEEVWSRMLTTLVALGDLRVIEPLVAVGERLFARESPMMRRLREELAEAVEGLRGQRPPEPVDDEAALARLEAALAPVTLPVVRLPSTPAAPRTEVRAHPLDEARAALESGRLDEAQAALVAAWQRVRAPRIANLVDAIDARLGRAPLIDEWDEDANVDAERLWSLRGTDDPRVATLLCRMFEDPPHIAPREHGTGVEDFWGALLDALRDLRDRRAIEPMIAFAKRAPGLCAAVDREARQNMYEQTPLGGFLEYQMTKVVEAIRGEQPVLSPEEVLACDALESALEAELRAASAAEEKKRMHLARGKALREQIAGALEDDAPRRAYAAWLRSSHDALDHAHADVIDRQLDGEIVDAEDTERIEDHVLAELAPHAYVRRWERGFPAALEVHEAYGIEAVTGHPSWSTVVELTIHSWSMYEATMCKLALHPVMSAVRSLSGVSASGLVTLTRARPQPFVHVALDLQNQGSHRWSGSLREALDRMPALRSLELILYPHDLKIELAPLLAWPVISRLEYLTFSIRTQPYSFPTAWIDARAEIEASALRELRVQWEGFCARFGRDARGRLGSLVMEHSHRRTYQMGEVLRLLWAVPPDALSSFTLVDADLHPTEHELAALRRALLHSPDAAITLPPARDLREHVRSLIQALSGEEYAARRAAGELAELHAIEARDALVACAADSSSEHLRMGAVLALTRLADGSSIPGLLRAVKRPEEPSGRVAGVVLGLLGAREAVDDIVAQLAQRDAQFAIDALMMLGAPESIPHLERVLDSADKQPRFAAIDALGVLGAHASAPRIRALVRGKDVYDRRHAITALALLGDRSDLELIDAAPRNDPPSARRRALARALLGGEEAALVRTIGEWENAEVRDQAVLGLALERVIATSKEAHDAIVQFAATIINEERARIADAATGGWSTPMHRFVLATFERVLARFTTGLPAVP